MDCLSFGLVIGIAASLESTKMTVGGAWHIVSIWYIFVSVGNVN